MEAEWNVYTNGRWIGTVHEANETLARCAALSRFGADDDEPFDNAAPRIFPDADFSVTKVIY